MGKTTLARALIRRLSPHKTYVVDPLYEYRDLAAADPENVFIENDDHLAAYLAKDAYDQATRGRKTLIVFDELEFYGKRKSDEEWLKKLYLTGRHWGISIIAIAKRYAGLGQFEGVPPLVRSQSSELYLFRVTEPTDIEYVKKKTSPEIAEALPNLAPWHYFFKKL